MIDARELRIGNWVSIEGKECWLTKQKFKTGVITLNCLGVEPIPLTEEWLEKFGFEKTHENPFTDYEWQFGWFTLSEDLKPYLGRYTDEVPFKHVHQLQNLYFALTGEELQLKEI